SPQSHSYLCSWGLTPLPPLSNSNYLGYMFFREPYRIAPCYQACGCNITIPKRNGIQKTSIMNEENLLRDWIQIIVESA
ncbi:hypothetical protein, partial [Salmonella enterica]